MAEQTMIEKQVEAFTDENPFAERAAADLAWLDQLLEGPDDPRTPHVLARAQANATLAVAYEQRQTRFDLLGIARGEL